MENEILNKLYQLRLNEKMDREMTEIRNQKDLVWSILIRDFIQSKIEEYKTQR